MKNIKQSNQVRIIGGIHRGRKLAFADAEGLRDLGDERRYRRLVGRDQRRPPLPRQPLREEQQVAAVAGQRQLGQPVLEPQRIAERVDLGDVVGARRAALRRVHAPTASA